MSWIRLIGVCQVSAEGHLVSLWDLALLSCEDWGYSLKRALPGVLSVSSFIGIFSFGCIGFSTVAFTIDCPVVLTLGVGILLATLGVGVSLATLGADGCISCGGFVIASKVTCLLLSFGVVAVLGMLLRRSSIHCNASISSMLFFSPFSQCMC
jgi:hypothetical protein